MNMEGGQFFFLTEGKVTHEWPVYFCQHLFSFKFLTVMILIRPCCALPGAIFDTDQNDDNSNCIFILGAGISR